MICYHLQTETEREIERGQTWRKMCALSTCDLCVCHMFVYAFVHACVDHPVLSCSLYLLPSLFHSLFPFFVCSHVLTTQCTRSFFLLSSTT